MENTTLDQVIPNDDQHFTDNDTDDHMRLIIKTFKSDDLDEYAMMIIIVMMVGYGLFSNPATSKLIKSSFICLLWEV